jgi:hypothetical protein
MSERESSLYTEILLVEDNPGDVVLTRRALKSGKVLHNLHVANDGRRLSSRSNQRARMRESEGE